jgi:ribosomal protein L14E/L6E/L27E
MLKAGAVVHSMAGHDKSRFYAVLRTENGFAWIADGKARRLDKPKRKSERHLRKTNTVLDPATLTSDRKLRVMLRPFNAPAGDTEREES